MAELDRGLSWPTFAQRVANFSPISAWAELLRTEGGRPIEDPDLAVRALESLG